VPRSARLGSRPHVPSNGERRGEDVQEGQTRPLRIRPR
jgi:hypothetical protein